jgi:hypothetical protein
MPAGGVLTLLAGFVATPLLANVVSYVGRCHLGVAALAVGAGGLFLQAALHVRRRRAPPGEAGPGGPLPDYLTVRFPLWVWAAGALFSLLVSSSYLLWSLEVPAGGGTCYVGTGVFDFEKHLIVTVSLMGGGVPAEAAPFPGVPLVYYTGFYVAPAAAASLVPAAVLQSLVSQFLIAGLLYVLLGYWCLAVVLKGHPGWVKVGLLFLVTGLACINDEFPACFHTRLKEYLLRFLEDPPTDVRARCTPFVMLQWVPQHALSTALGLWCLLAVGNLTRREWVHRVVWTLASAFLVASSAFVAVVYLPVLLLEGVRRLTPPAGAAPACGPDADGAGDAGWRFVGTLAASLAVQALVALPTYVPILHAHLGPHDPAHGVVRANDATLSSSLQVLFCACGLSLLAAPAAPAAFRRAPALVLPWAFGLLGCAVHVVYADDLGAKAMQVASIALPLAAFVCVVLLWQRPGLAGKLAAGLLLAGFTANAFVSAAVEYSWAYKSAKYDPKVPGAEAALVKWVRLHTSRTDRVAQLQDRRLNYNYLLMRRAVAAGEDLTPRLQHVFLDREALARYARDNRGKPLGPVPPDYVYVAKGPTYLIYDWNLTEEPGKCLDLLRRYGYSVVFENAAGWVARRGP